jgi:hypothetical protein
MTFTTQDKIIMLADKINQHDIAIEIINKRIASGEPDVEGKPLMQDLLDNHLLIRSALNAEMETLTNL